MPKQKPERIQRKRTKGWKMPPNTIYVGRPSIYGNPWTIQKCIASKLFGPELAHQICVDEFAAWLEGIKSPNDEQLGVWNHPAMIEKRAKILASLPELRGKNLACWCKPGQPCHADVLLKLANS
jgi:hypothetical protein